MTKLQAAKYDFGALSIDSGGILQMTIDLPADLGVWEGLENLESMVGWFRVLQSRPNADIAACNFVITDRHTKKKDY